MHLRRSIVPALLLLALLPATPATADPGRANQDRVDARLARVRGILADARSTAAALARALHAADQELRAGQARLALSRRQLAAARDRAMRARAALAAAEARVERVQAEVDARARNAWMTGAAPPVLGVSLLVTADSPTELLGRAKLVERVAAERGAVLTELAAARDDADRVRAARDEAERDATIATSAVAAQVTQLAEVRVARARAKVRLDRRVRALETAADDLAAESGRIQALIRARDAAARARAAAVAGRGRGGLSWPVSCPLTSGFGARWGHMHEGIDLGCPLGTEVRAAKGGVVLSASWAGGYGKLVLVSHGGGLVTAYGHNSALLVRPGQAVSRGQVLARSGSTGHSTGPHVHFEVRVDGVPRDPLAWLQ
jgi:murein DD-endopeptidase MepM/ murein hydrolase activator NlpD